MPLDVDNVMQVNAPVVRPLAPLQRKRHLLQLLSLEVVILQVLRVGAAPLGQLGQADHEAGPVRDLDVEQAAQKASLADAFVPGAQVHRVEPDAQVVQVGLLDQHVAQELPRVVLHGEGRAGLAGEDGGRAVVALAAGGRVVDLGHEIGDAEADL